MLNTNEDVFAGQWKSLRKKAKQQWMSLTEDDIKRVDGNADVLADIVAERYGYSQDKAWEEIRQFAQMYATPNKARA